MINLSSQRHEFAVVVSDLARCFNYKLLEFDHFLNNSGFRYYYIIHDNDVSENGEVIRPHLHLVVTGLKRWRVKQLLNDLADCLDTNVENIQIEEVKNITASIQYLIHKNDTAKYQYDYRKIFTNDSDNLVPILNETIKTSTITTDRLIDLILKDKVEKLELIKIIGIGSYSHFKSAINDLYEIRYHKDLQ